VEFSDFGQATVHAFYFQKFGNLLWW
jgi:hypothetical protein